jgi:aerobic carbon-monoxide dehydrogenase medium subunit
VKPAPFDYHAPRSLGDAVALLGELDDAKAIAGGQSLAPLLNMRLAVFSDLVDLRHVDELRGIERRGDTLWIGAGTTQATIERSAEVAEAVPLLSRVTPLIGHFQIRNRGTIGGSLAHADPAAEYPAVALALDADLEVASSRGTRVVPAAGFFDGLWTTTMAEDELLTAVRFPIWEGRCGFAVEEIARRHGDFAVAGACVALQLDDRGVVSRCRIGLFGLGSTPVRPAAAEESAEGNPAGDVDGRRLGAAAVADLSSIPDDLNGSARYRRRVGAVAVARAWEQAVEEAG